MSYRVMSRLTQIVVTCDVSCHFRKWGTPEKRDFIREYARPFGMPYVLSRAYGNAVEKKSETERK